MWVNRLRDEFDMPKEERYSLIVKALSNSGEGYTDPYYVLMSLLRKVETGPTDPCLHNTDLCDTCMEPTRLLYRIIDSDGAYQYFGAYVTLPESLQRTVHYDEFKNNVALLHRSNRVTEALEAWHNAWMQTLDSIIEIPVVMLVPSFCHSPKDDS